MIPANLLRFLKIIGVAAIVLSLSRLIFLINDPQTFLNTGWSNLSIALIHGIRFDLVTIAYGFIPIWIWLIFVPNKWPKLFNWTFLVILGLATFANAIDTEFFKFTAKRMTSDIFRFIFLSDDVFHIGFKILLSFWYLVVSWWVINYLAYWLTIRKLVLSPPKKGSFNILGTILMVGLVVLLMRGGFQKYPLSVHHASDYGSPSNVSLVLNSPFTYIKSLGKKPLIDATYYTNNVARSHFNPVIDLPENEFFGSHAGKNVVILIVESLSKEYCGFINGKKIGYTPFLDSLASSGLVVTDAYANGYRSITGIPAIISSLPCMMYEPVVTSGFLMNDYSGLPDHLQDLGYSSYFFHGGNPGTMGFESFSRTAGFDHYIDRADYTDQSHYDGHWGIYDHQFLQFAADQLTKAKEPFVATAFTLSSHHPYTIPTEFSGRFPKGKLAIHESIGYADHSLRLFFEHARNQPWYDSTLFVITTDHTSLTEGGFFGHYAGKLSIPIVFYSPSDSTLENTFDQYTSQVDIVPSVLHLLGYDRPFVSFGSSIFDSLAPRQNIMFSKHKYQIIKDSMMLRFDGTTSNSLYNLKTDSLLQNNLVGSKSGKVDSLEATLKSYMQQFSERMYGNHMTNVDE